MLRQLEINDEQEIFTLRTDREVNKYLDRQVTNSIEDARDFINIIHENIKKNDSLYWAITMKDENTLIGTICLFDFSDESSSCEIGYELLPQYQRQGIMKEAIEKVIDYAFNIIKVKNIEAFLHRDNQGSIKLLEKLSFENTKNDVETNPKLVSYYLTNTSDKP